MKKGAKYDWIRTHYGEQALLDVLTNIRFAKAKLKEAQCYKKGETQQGGLGGIGVEHWILQHEGDAIKAFKAFADAAYDSSGNLVPFKHFQQRYKIFSAGENIRNNQRAENFIYNMSEPGYQKMAQLARTLIH